MSRIRTTVAQAIIDQISNTIRFAKPATVVAAPPSSRTDYPAIAILVDGSTFDIMTDGYVEFDPTKQPGDLGYIIDGIYATDANGCLVEGSMYIDGGTGQTISQIGTMHLKTRIWVGSRSASQRESIEDDITLAFYADDAAPGRMLVKLDGIIVGGVVLPTMYGAADLDSSSWNAEHAFDERLWSYLMVDVDVPIVVPRSTSVASQLVLSITADLATPISSVADLAELSDVRQFSVDADGNPVPFTP